MGKKKLKIIIPVILIVVQAFYGKEIGLLWNFTLELEDGLLWKIAKIENKEP